MEFNKRKYKRSRWDHNVSPIMSESILDRDMLMLQVLAAKGNFKGDLRVLSGERRKFRRDPSVADHSDSRQ